MPRRLPTGPVPSLACLVAATLKQKRLEAGRTLEELADCTGISISSLSRFENGKYKAKLEQLEVWATALESSISDLVAACSEGGRSSGLT